MSEYQPRWLAAKKSANTHQVGTDRTDKRAFVSSVSGELAPISAKNLRQHLIVAAASIDPSRFDREHYDDSWQQWRALPDPDEVIADLEAQLDTGWQWMQSHPDHPEHESFLDRWIGRLRDYEHATTQHRGGKT